MMSDWGRREHRLTTIALKPGMIIRGPVLPEAVEVLAVLLAIGFVLTLLGEFASEHDLGEVLSGPFGSGANDRLQYKPCCALGQSEPLAGRS